MRKGMHHVLFSSAALSPHPPSVFFLPHTTREMKKIAAGCFLAVAVALAAVASVQLISRVRLIAQTGPWSWSWALWTGVNALLGEWNTTSFETLSYSQLRCPVFLYVKGVLAHESHVLRKEQFAYVVGVGVPHGVPEQAWPLPRRRLQQALLGDDTPFAHVPSTWHTFGDMKAWSDPATSWVFFRDAVPGSLVVRASSTTGSCFLQAPSVLAHYLTWQGGADTGGTLDLIAFMQDHVSARDLWRFVYDHGQGSSLQVFADLAPRSRLLTRDPWFLLSLGASQKVTRLLDQHGPALVRYVGCWLFVCLFSLALACRAAIMIILVMCPCPTVLCRPMLDCLTPSSWCTWGSVTSRLLDPTACWWWGGDRKRAPAATTCDCWCRTGGTASSSLRWMWSIWRPEGRI